MDNYNRQKARCEYTQLEEQMREYSALGNARAVRLLLNAGVNVNSTNSVNGWTALHWACRRNQPTIVDILLNVGGADPMLRNRNGQVARDLTSDEVIRQMLDAKHPTSDSATIPVVNSDTADPTDSILTKDVQSGPESSSVDFIPSYLRYPEADKLWELPANIKPTASSSAYQDVHPLPPNLDVGAVSSQNATPAMTKLPVSQNDIHTERTVTNSPRTTSDLPEPVELLIYQDQRDEDHLLGAVFPLPSTPIQDLTQVIREELDDVPDNFKLYRHNGQQSIPMNKRQMSAAIAQHFRSASDAIVIKPVTK